MARLNAQKWLEHRVFSHLDIEMCFAPQRRALFRHLNFQKWSECGVFVSHLCVGFLFLVLCPVRLSSASACSAHPSFFLSHNFVARNFVTQNFATHNFVTNNFVTHTQICHTHTTLSPTTSSHTPLSHIQLCHTQFRHTQTKM